MEDNYDVFPKVGATFKKLMELEQFDELVTQSVPVYTLKESKKLLEEMSGSPVTAAVKLWFAAITLSLKKVEEDCVEAHINFTQDDKDKISYFANKVIKAFGAKPHVPILISEMLKDYYDIDFSHLEDGEERYERMFRMIDHALEKKSEAAE